MYFCNQCRKEFEFVRIEFFPETGKRKQECPFCQGTDFFEEKGIFCQCCGSRLKNPGDLYCSVSCRRLGLRLWKQQKSRDLAAKTDPLVRAVGEVDEYNRQTGCHLSYGQYYALKGADLI